MKFASSHLGNTVISNLYVRVNGQEATELNIIADDLAKINDKKHFFELVEGQLKFTEKPPSPISPQKQARIDLKAKMEDGTATDTDIKEALKLLL